MHLRQNKTSEQTAQEFEEWNASVNAYILHYQTSVELKDIIIQCSEIQKCINRQPSTLYPCINLKTVTPRRILFTTVCEQY
jgi:hypothetical protein